MTSLTKIASTIIIILVAVLIGSMWTLWREDIPAAQIDPLYMNEASQIITLPSGQTVHLRDQGRDNSDAILLLHGSNASLHSWEPWVERLSKRYRIISVDLPGHGLTGPHIKDDYSKGAYVQFIDEVATQLGLDHFVIGGSSMGGDISWRYALEYPQKVRGMILVASGGYPIAKGDSDGPIIFSLLRFAPFRWLFQKIHSHGLVKEGLRTAYHNSPVVTDKLISRYEDLNLRQGQRRASALRFAEQMNFPASPPPRGVINIPTLILWGRQDKLVPIKYAQKFQRDLSNSTLVIYDNVGHMPQEEIPGRSARDVQIFLEGLNWSKQ